VAAGLRRDGHAEQAASIKHTRWALLKNPELLTGDQRSTLAAIQATNGPLYRAYLLKEQLRAIFQTRDLAAAKCLLIGWLAWAQRCRLDPFVKLTKTIKKYRQLILGRSPTACRAPAPRPPTPTCGCSPAAPTATTPRSRSSPWPSSPEADSAHPSPDDHENHPRKCQESRNNLALVCDSPDRYKSTR